MLELIVLIAAAFVCIWTPVEVNKVRNGWVPRKFKGDHAAFVVKYRKQLTLIGWLGLILGPLFILIGVLDYEDNLRLAVKLLGGALWLGAGTVALLSRRKLDDIPAPATAPLPPPH